MRKNLLILIALVAQSAAQEPDVFHLMTKKDTAAKIPRLTVTGNVPVALVRIIDSHLVLEPFGGKVSGTGEARFREIALNGDNYVGFKAPDDIPSNVIWKLPPTDGLNGHVLATKGTGELYWSSASGSAFTGSGTTNYVTKFTGPQTLGNSQIFDNGTSVGIGTTNPLGKFHIVNSDTGPNGLLLRLQNTVPGGLTNLAWENDATNVQMWLNGSEVLTGAGPNAFTLYQTANAPIVIHTNTSERMRITGTGRVGIGTTNPEAKLNVEGSSEQRIALLRGFKLFEPLTFVHNQQNSGTAYVNDPRRTAQSPWGPWPAAIRGETQAANGVALLGVQDTTSSVAGYQESAGVFGWSNAGGNMTIGETISPGLISAGVWGRAVNPVATNIAGVVGESWGPNGYSGLFMGGRGVRIEASVNDWALQINNLGSAGGGRGLRINAGGSGTPIPTFQVEALGNPVFKISAGAGSIIQETIAADNTSFAAYMHNDGGVGRVLRLKSGSTGGIPILQLESSSILMVANANGRVGIGITDPLSKLTIGGNPQVGASDLGIRSSGPGRVMVVENAAANDRMVLYQDGQGLLKLGLSVSTPANRLDIAGGGVSIGYPGTVAPNNGLILSGSVGIGTPNPAATLHVVGNFSVTGGTKNFDIDHPTQKGRLIHAAIEGPEAAVYYRGQGRLERGHARIELPGYFEALTRKEGRTVLLTPTFEGNEPVSALAASPIIEGAFRVKFIDGKNPSQPFTWEVKAVRADVDPLKVERLEPEVRQ